MKKYAFHLSLAAGVIIVMAAVFAWHWQPVPVATVPVTSAPAPAPDVVVAPPPPASTAAEPPAPAPVTAEPPALRVTPPRAVSENEAKRREATDYLEFAREMLPKAKAGDRDAQYQLYAAMDYCRSGYRGVFDIGQTRRSLDEVLTAQPLPPRVDADIRQLHSRCEGLMSAEGGEFGEAQQWLTRSAAGGFPPAQLDLAEKMAQAGNTLSGEQATRSIAEARRLARAALTTGDPDLVWRARLMNGLGLATADSLDARAWARAACDRGLDCGPGSEAARELCRQTTNCLPSESVYDLLRRSVDDPAALEADAKRVNALIDARDWRTLGIEEAPAGR